MLKFLTISLTLLTSGLLAFAQAQETPAPKTPAAAKPAAKSAAAAKPVAKKPATATAAKPGAAKPLTTEKEKFSYALGMNFGGGLGAKLRQQSVDFDPALAAEGFKDALAGGKTRMTEAEERAALTEMQSKMQAKAQQQAEANKKEGETFLAANKSKEDIVALPSGLQYKILKAGTGPKPTADDTVVCNYRGTLINGKEFDSSYKRNEPATFPVNGVIKGWTEALQLMPVGSKWQLFIPASLAYGDRGTPGGDIPGNSTLIFEVELLSIQPKAAPPAAPAEKK